MIVLILEFLMNSIILLMLLIIIKTLLRILIPRLRIDFNFLWYDFWVGFYYDRKTKHLYFCPLPMCVFVFSYIQHYKKE
jgi:hypothetical protein